MANEERYRECRNCGRNQPESKLNREGRCETCGPSDTPERAPESNEPAEAKGKSKKGSEETEESGGE